MVKNPPSNAGDTGSIPGHRTKIPHARGATKPAQSGARMPQLESLSALEPTRRNEDHACSNWDPMQPNKLIN